MILKYSSSIMEFRRLLRLIFVTITLLLFTGCAVNGVHDQQVLDGHSSGDDDGSGLMPGSGSGSGQVYEDDKSQTNQLKCSVDTSDVPFTSIGQEDAVLQAECRSVCLEKVLANETLPHNLISTDEFYPTVSTKSLRNNCSVYQKVYECAVGCEMGNDQSCSSNCYDMCSDNSPSYLPNSSCPLSCSKAVCAIGCGLYEELNTIASEGSVPEHPSSYTYSFNQYSSPYFHAPAAYNITFQTNDKLNSTTITGFVIKLTTDEHTTHYYLPSFDTPLVIDSSLACQTVIVQILPVNKFGPAQNYSSKHTIVTDGGMWPQWPDHPQLYSLDYSITEDVRDGYWQHAIVNITWNTPHNGEFLTGYTIELLSDDQFNCGPTLEITDIQQTYFVWQASIPADSPISGCNYDIKVFSNPHNSTYPGIPGVLNVPIDNLNNSVPMGLIAPIDIKCSLQDIEGNILYLKPRMEWMLLSNPLLLQGIKEFQLTLIGRTDGNDQSILKTDIIQFMMFRNVRSQKIHFITTYSTLLQELTIIYEPGFTQYFNTSYSCSHHLIQPPPIVEVIPNDIYIDHTTGDLHIDVMWEEPMFSDGDISDYLVYVGKTVQPNDTILIDNTTHFLVSTTSVHRYIEEVLQSPNDINSDWYIQVQSISSIGLRSIWSSPYVFDPLTSEFHVTVELSCKHLFQESHIQASFQTHQLYIHWTVSSTKLEGLKGFDIIATYTGDFKNKDDEHIIDYKNTQDEYSYIFNETVGFNDHFNYYELEVALLFKEGYPNRGPATHPYCILDGSLLPPSTIDYNLVKVDTLQIDKFGRLNISMDWPKPDLSNGGIRQYWVYIGPTSLSGTEEPHDYVLFTKDLLYSHYHQSNIDIYKQLQSQFGNGKSWKLYIQVLSINNVQVMSNWTTAHVIVMDAFELVEYPMTSTTVLPSPTITKNPATTPTTDAYQKLVPVLSVIIPIIFVLTLAIILVIVLITIACCQRKKIGNKKQKHLMVDVNQRMDAGYLWERFPSDVEKMLLIGEGTFGDVYSGVLHQTIGKKQFDDDSVNVFIATLKVSSSEDERFEFVNVLEKHKALSNVDHPFFLFFQGCVTSSQPYYLMTDFAENGDLLTFLQNHKRRLLSETASIRDHTITQDKVSSYLHYQHPSFENLCPGDLLNYSRQIASAMDCLTGLGIIHGDLACRNIYIDQNFNLKVTDFGIVNNGHRGVIYVNGVPIRWVSPKVLINHTYSTTSDIWAFGVTVWEIVTLGDFPYQDIHNEDLLKSLTEGNRLPKPNNCSPLFYSTLLSCWDINPKRRPAFEKLHETFLNQLSKNEASILLTIPLSTQEPHPSLYSGEPRTDMGTKSPTSDHSSDSAISDVGITKHDELISATNPGFTRHSIKDVPVPIHKGFVNPGFRRSSTKSVNLDSPSFQIFRSNPATEQAAIPLAEISEKDVTIDTTNTTTEV